jgi:hypothetical protein
MFGYLLFTLNSPDPQHTITFSIQLNDEAASLDWTKSSGHVLSGRKVLDSYEDEFLEPEGDVVGHKLGGGSSSRASARVLSGVAAYQRLLNASSTELESSHNRVATSVKKPDPDDAGQDFVQRNVKVELDPDDNDAMAIVTSGSPDFVSFTVHNTKGYSEPDAEKNSIDFVEPDPDDSLDAGTLNKEMEIDSENDKEPDPDDGTSGFGQESRDKMEVETELKTNTTVLKSEPDPDDSSKSLLNQEEVSIDGRHMGEPDPDAMESGNNIQAEIEQSRNLSILNSEPDPDDATDLSSNELQRIEEPVAALCSRLQKAIEMLRSQATPSEAASVLQTLFKIIKNVIENPNDIRYKRLRKVCLVSLCFGVFFLSTETDVY